MDTNAVIASAAKQSRKTDAKGWIAASAFGLLAMAGISGETRADAIEDFYKTKTLNMIIGLGEGGGYDLSARLVAQHLSDSSSNMRRRRRLTRSKKRKPFFLPMLQPAHQRPFLGH